MQMLEGKHIILGVTGSISAFKAVALASKLTQAGALVDVIATQNALKLIAPAQFEGVTHRKCLTDVFENAWDLSQSHVTVGNRADLAIVAPCSANMLAKIAHGIADDKLSTTILALRCPLLVAPAMNCFMYENAATQANLAVLRKRGVSIIEPDSGALACNYVGKGRLPDPDVLMEIILRNLPSEKRLLGKKVLVTAGATREPIDAVRYISNPSTGKMGYACARAALMAGAEVTLVTGADLPPVLGAHMLSISTAAQMAEAVFEHAPTHDIVIMAAAVSDFTPADYTPHKIHKTDAALTIPLQPTTDILAELGKRKSPSQFLCGFSMETDDLIARSQEKLRKKNLDMIVANSIARPDTGFAVDTNAVTVFTPTTETLLPLASKQDIASRLIELIATQMKL